MMEATTVSNAVRRTTRVATAAMSADACSVAAANTTPAHERTPP